MEKFNFYQKSDKISKKPAFNRTAEPDILNAAKRVFYRKGLYGARMQEIAEEAGINKAMLHYYFRSKDKLFDAVFSDAAENFFSKIENYINTDLPLFEKIEFFVENYIDLLLKNLEIPSFIITEIHHNPDRIKRIFAEKGLTVSNKLLSDIMSAVSVGKIHPIDPFQLMLNIISLCIFPVAAKPLVQAITNKGEEDYMKFIELRKKEVSKFIISAIKIHV
jgi:TetR/AcrR family transcriptional regulator